jgi:hypothetical protein
MKIPKKKQKECRSNLIEKTQGRWILKKNAILKMMPNKISSN